jgi:hypothetical protein
MRTKARYMEMANTRFASYQTPARRIQRVFSFAPNLAGLQARQNNFQKSTFPLFTTRCQYVNLPT